MNKRPIEDILNDSKTIDPKKIAQEVIKWTINNVPNFIDNQTKIFKLDLVIDDNITENGLAETKRLQDLYKAIPEDEELKEEESDKAEKCRRKLDLVTLEAYNIMKDSKELLKELFKSMIFYYEKVIPSAENKKRAFEIDKKLKELINQKEEEKSEEVKKKIQEKIVEAVKEGESLIKFEEFEGAVGITRFEYESFEVKVQVKRVAKESEKREDREVVKEYNIPEGFILWLEINYRHKKKLTSMF